MSSMLEEFNTPAYVPNKRQKHTTHQVICLNDLSPSSAKQIIPRRAIPTGLGPEQSVPPRSVHKFAWPADLVQELSWEE